MPWLAEGKYVWIATGANLLALVIALRPGASEPLIRLSGLALQVLGIATVIWGISETRALFGHPSITTKAKAWLQRFPLRNRNVVVGVAGIACGTSVGTARGFGTHGAGPNPTLDARIDALEKNVTAIHDRITAAQKEMDAGLQKAGADLKGEAQIRQTEDAEIRSKLEATGTGGVHISAIGASWLFVGVVLSTAAPELAQLLK